MIYQVADGYFQSGAGDEAFQAGATMADGWYFETDPGLDDYDEDPSRLKNEPSRRSSSMRYT